MESCQYRGYQIETRHEWSSWCVSIYRTHSNIPILQKPTLHISAPLKDDVVAVAKRSIDQVLSTWPAYLLSGKQENVAATSQAASATAAS
jgi:hypothetical protein